MARITRQLGDWVRDLLEYNPETGEFFWLRNTNRVERVGTRAGAIYDAGYRYIQIYGEDYRAGRLAWFFVTGEDPPTFIDHKNRIRDDDRFENLRLATNSQNQANAWWSTNTSGIRGVRYQPSRKKWIAVITINGKAKNIGRFNTRLEAAKAYRRAAIEAWGEFAKVPSEEELEAMEEM